MTKPPFTDDQLAALADLIDEAVYHAMQPVARQVTVRLQAEALRLERIARRPHSAPPGRRLDPDDPKHQPPLGEPTPAQSEAAPVHRDPPGNF